MRVCKCPNCGANLEFKDDDRNFMFCQYCGAKILLDDYRSSHTEHIIDEAKIKETDTIRFIKLRELELQAEREKHSKFTRIIYAIIWAVLSLILIFTVVHLWNEDDSLSLFLTTFIVIPIIIGGGYFIFAVLPDKELDRTIAQSGGIRFPKITNSFSNMNYNSFSAMLKELGFTNVSGVNLHDIKIGILQKKDSIESISIDGKNITSGGRWYKRDAKIIITYHGR